MRSLDILNLLADSLQLGLDRNHPFGDRGILAFRADGVHFPIHLLDDEIELLTTRSLPRHRFTPQGEMTAKASQLLRDVAALDHPDDLHGQRRAFQLCRLELLDAFQNLLPFPFLAGNGKLLDRVEMAGHRLKPKVHVGRQLRSFRSAHAFVLFQCLSQGGSHHLPCPLALRQISFPDVETGMEPDQIGKRQLSLDPKLPSQRPGNLDEIFQQRTVQLQPVRAFFLGLQPYRHVHLPSSDSRRHFVPNPRLQVSQTRGHPHPDVLIAMVHRSNLDLGEVTLVLRLTSGEPGHTADQSSSPLVWNDTNSSLAVLNRFSPDSSLRWRQGDPVGPDLLPRTGAGTAGGTRRRRDGVALRAFPSPGPCPPRSPRSDRPVLWWTSGGR